MCWFFRIYIIDTFRPKTLRWQSCKLLFLSFFNGFYKRIISSLIPLDAIYSVSSSTHGNDSAEWVFYWILCRRTKVENKVTTIDGRRDPIRVLDIILHLWLLVLPIHNFCGSGYSFVNQRRYLVHTRNSVRDDYLYMGGATIHVLFYFYVLAWISGAGCTDYNWIGFR